MPALDTVCSTTIFGQMRTTISQRVPLALVVLFSFNGFSLSRGLFTANKPRGVARGGLRGLEHPLCMLYNDVIQTQVKLTLYCFATLTLLLKLVAFVFKLKFTVAELAISCSTSTALVYTSSYCFSLGS